MTPKKFEFGAKNKLLVSASGVKSVTRYYLNTFHYRAAPLRPKPCQTRHATPHHATPASRV